MDNLPGRHLRPAGRRLVLGGLASHRAIFLSCLGFQSKQHGSREVTGLPLRGGSSGPFSEREACASCFCPGSRPECPPTPRLHLRFHVVPFTLSRLSEALWRLRLRGFQRFLTERKRQAGVLEAGGCILNVALWGQVGGGGGWRPRRRWSRTFHGQTQVLRTQRGGAGVGRWVPACPQRTEARRSPPRILSCGETSLVPLPDQF